MRPGASYSDIGNGLSESAPLQAGDGIERSPRALAADMPLLHLSRAKGTHRACVRSWELSGCEAWARRRRSIHGCSRTCREGGDSLLRAVRPEAPPTLR